MNINDCVLSRANTIGEVGAIIEELERLPRNYNPFPHLGKDRSIGVINLIGTILLTPMVGKTNIYEGPIYFPDGASKIRIEGLDEDPMGIMVAGRFSFEGFNYTLYRTEAKHRNP